MFNWNICEKKTLKQWTVFTFDIAYIEHYKRDCWKICKFHCFHFFWLLGTSYKKVHLNCKLSLRFVKIFAGDSTKLRYIWDFAIPKFLSNEFYCRWLSWIHNLKKITFVLQVKFHHLIATEIINWGKNWHNSILWQYRD